MPDNQTRLRILLIEDDEDDVLITRELLEEGSSLPVDLDWIDTADAGLAALRERRHDVALVDYRLGPESGIDVIRQAQKEAINTPMILLTGQGDQELDLRAVEIGAADYLVKGLVDAPSLIRSVRYAIDRSMAIDSLAQSEARYRLLFDSNPVPMLLTEPETGVILSMNDAALTLYGADRRDFGRLALSDLQGAGSALTSEPGTGGMITQPGAALEVHRRFDGSDIYVETRSQGMVVERRRINLVMVVDITERIENSRELRLMKQGIESSYNGIIIANAREPDVPIVYVNPAFERITGFTAAESVGRNCRFLQEGGPMDPGTRSALEEVRRGLAENSDVSVVLRNFRKDGTPFWNDLFIAPIRDDSGEVTHFIGVQNDISEKKSVESELAYNVSHDVLTGLPNRTLLEDRLSQGCQMARRYGRKVGVLFLDLDGFKPINDSLGHRVGDQILIEVANRLKARVRSGDTVARGSGDEFVVVLPDLAHGDDIIKVVELLLHAVAQPYEVDGRSLRLTASAGIALDDGTREHPMELVQQADLAMYRAKQQGRNTYQWYASDLNDEANERVELRNDLQKALENGQLVLFYQPLIDSRTGRVRGSEALIRWYHPSRGLIPPNAFIPLAEDTGQIIELGTWVLYQACRDAVRLQGLGYREHRISVNVSPMQLRQGNFSQKVTDTLRQTGLAPELLELEIVESAILYDTEQVIEHLRQLRALGVGIAIDDFGTGFSSLSYLKLMPVTKIKIDRAFIKDVISNRSDAAITQGILSMAHHLALEVVAEGVETEAHAAFLRKNNCEMLQGYLFARPMPFAELLDYLGQRSTSPSPESPDGASPATASQPTLLLLDDEANILRALIRVLRRDGYRILSTTSVQEAFELLAGNNVQVIISDQRMPEMSGTEFLSQVKNIYPHTVRIVLSGYTDLKSVTDAINEGAIYKFLTKPWDDQQIRNHIRQAFVYHGASAD
ncbi:PAS domain S-box-containing protein/diguanylate cyclase (GGDEF) domain-containing protein [Marinobacter daqiaonensis]|uniref:cyclic-guanylate-specific phosphodiesterase n=1 Tax=Marinobacter daqiaonensis TaxID=650891 RepID=A0A1I6IKF5_9GAMM|nr:EAL domain-containing protein [Marinobacter daqiaonensis]SFR67205.1 PAS domain S-box-containing protein/diguanylate cyclase (GGDEF) domain-containing protein [Marinobacter daqiaonensis]